MIISFSNLGGGGGSYTLPTATATRLGGVKIGSGVNVDTAGTISVNEYQLSAATQSTLGGVIIGSGITVDSAGTISAQEYTLPTASSEVLGGIKVGSGLTITDGVLSADGGGADENAQHRFTAATESDMEDLTAMTEGDICVVPEHTEAMPNIFYTRLRNGYTLDNSLEAAQQRGVTKVRFTLIESPYYDGESQTYLDGYWQKEDAGYYEGFGIENGTDWYNLPDIQDITTEKVYMSVGDHYDFDFIFLSSSSYYNNDTALIVYPQNTQYQYGLSAESLVAQTTYQYNNGEWIKLANNDEVQSLSRRVQTVNELIDYKLNGGGNYEYPSSWSDLAYYSPFLSPVMINGVDQGYRIHVDGATTERTNPKVTELVMSPSLGYMVALTQDQYDALVSGGTVDSQTFYIIIPDNS